MSDNEAPVFKLQIIQNVSVPADPLAEISDQ